VIYLARHGETGWNREGRYQGRQESTLTQTGVAQAEALANALKERNIVRVISSPLGRCVETAQPLAHRLGIEIETDGDLIEIAHGTWEGRLRSEIERDDPDTLRRWREQPDQVHFEGGESLAEVAARWERFAAGLGNEDRVAVVTHDVIARVAILAATQRPLAQLWQPRVVNGGYAEFVPGSWTVVRECVDEHLGDLAVDTRAQAL